MDIGHKALSYIPAPSFPYPVASIRSIPPYLNRRISMAEMVSQFFPPVQRKPYSARPSWDTDADSGIPESASRRTPVPAPFAGSPLWYQFQFRCHPGIWNKRKRRIRGGRPGRRQLRFPAPGTFRSPETGIPDRRSMLLPGTGDKPFIDHGEGKAFGREAAAFSSFPRSKTSGSFLMA